MRKRILEETKFWVPIVIALCALFLTIYQGNQIQLHNKLSVTPHMGVGYFSNDEKAGFNLHSTGLGPATIKWMTISIDGAAKDNWDEVTKALKFSPPVNYTFGYLFPGTVVKADSISNLYSVESSKDILKLNKTYNSVEIVICYCSIYGELDHGQCWQTSTDMRFMHK